MGQWWSLRRTPKWNKKLQLSHELDFFLDWRGVLRWWWIDFFFFWMTEKCSRQFSGYRSTFGDFFCFDGLLFFFDDLLHQGPM